MAAMDRDTILLNLISYLNKSGYPGITHIQKSFYVFQELHLKEPAFKYTIYQYGPYSFDLQEKVEEFLALGRVDRFVINDKGGIGYNLKKEPPETDYNNLLEKIVVEFGTKPVAELERICTTLYVVKQNPQEQKKAIVEKVKTIKPHFSEESIDEAFTQVNELLSKAS